MNRILIVEDEVPIAQLIEMSLARAGYQCEAVNDGCAAADKIEQNDYDLVLLDIMLPGLDGYELLEYLRPIMGDDGHGSIAAIEKVRGTQNAMRRLVELIAEGTREAAASSLTMVLSYCNCPERALMLKKEFLEKCAALREVILVPTSGLSTVYAYDGGIVLAY